MVTIKNIRQDIKQVKTENLMKIQLITKINVIIIIRKVKKQIFWLLEINIQTITTIMNLKLALLLKYKRYKIL